MGTLMINCPKTGSAISTGIQMDPRTFHNMPVFFARTLCPICQTQHEWFARAAWVREPKAQGEQPINLTRINRRHATVAMQPKWMGIAAILAAATVAAGFVAGTAAVDAYPVSGSVARSATFSTVAAKSTTHAITFPEPNRAAKANRLRIHIPEVGAAIEDATKDWENRAVQNRAPREGERKPVAHCEPVGSPIADPAVLHTPSRLCFARVGTLRLQQSSYV